jgi:hypothetical protein
MLSELKSWLRIKGKKSSRRRRTGFSAATSAVVEYLEQRQLLTIVVTPQFGPEIVTWNGGGNPPGESNNPTFYTGNPIITGPLAASSNSDAIKSPTIYLIFWGPNWINPATNQLDPSVNQMITAAQTIVSPSSGFLKGLTEFGSDGRATIGGAYYDPQNYNIQAQGGKIANAEMGNILYGNNTSLVRIFGPQSVPVPAANSSPTQSPNMYITIRTVNGGGGNAYETLQNTQNPNASLIAVNDANLDIGVGNLSNFGRLFSHELAERMSSGAAGDITTYISPTAVTYLSTPGATIPAVYTAPGSGGQIADGEPEQFGTTYNFRLNGPSGPIVQAYYSLSLQAYVVNDADPTQDFVLTPHWQVNGPTTWADAQHQTGQVNAQFLNYDLTLNVHSGDTLTIDAPPSGQAPGPVKITWNGHTETFDPGSLSTIQIIGVGIGNHTINVLHDFLGPTININLAGPGTSTDVFKYQGLLGLIPISLQGTQSFTVTTLTGQEIFYSLSANHTLQELVAGAWSTAATNVKSYQIGPWTNGFPFALYLTTDGRLFQADDGINFKLWQSNVQKFILANIDKPFPNGGAFNYLLVLDSNGRLTKSDGQAQDGSTSPVLAVGVADFQVAHWAGRQAILYLTVSHDLYTSFDGSSVSFQGSGILSFGVGQMVSDGWLFALTGNGTLQKSNGNGWQTIATSVQELQVARWAGRDYAFYLDNSGTLYSTLDATNWNNQGTHLTSFAVGSLEGLDTLFALSATGVLQRSTGNGWQTVATDVQSFQMADWASYKFVFYLDSTGTLFSSLDGVNWSNQGGPFQSFAAGNLQGTDYLFALTGAGVLQSSTGAGWNTVASGVQTFQMGRWFGLNAVFFLDSSGALDYSTDGALWLNLATSIDSFALGNLGGTDYLFSLTGTGVLQMTTNVIWQTIASGVQSFRLARWAGANYVLYLNNANTLLTSRDASTWANQGSAIQSFAVTALRGVNTLLALTTAGGVQRSTGSVWQLVTSGVQSLRTSYWAGANYAFYLTFGGSLNSSVDGTTWLNQGTLIQSFAAGKLNGIGYLLALTAGGVFQDSTGNGWHMVATGVRKIQLEFWAGANYAFYLDGAYTLWTSPTGSNWANQGGPYRSFSVGSLRGIHYLFALTGGAVLQQSTGSGWQTASIGVVSFQMARWAGANYVVYVDSSHTLSSSPDGVTWTTQDTGVTSFAIAALRGSNVLFDLTPTGVFKSSTGGGWHTVALNVSSFQTGDWAGNHYAFYLTSSNSLFSTLNGSTWVNQATNIQSFQVGTLSGVGNLFGLTTQGQLERSTGSGWIPVALQVHSLQMGWWAGSNTVFYLDGSQTLYSSPDGVNWSNQGTGIVSFAVVTLNGTDFLFALTSGGELQRSTGNFWVNVAGNIRFFFLNSSAGVPIVTYLTRSGQGYSTNDGYSWTVV